jgi:predicted transposase YdaD
MGKPHDGLFKTVFGDPTYARPALRAALPEELGRAINWDSLKLVPGTFVDEELVEKVSDLLCEAKAAGAALRDARVKGFPEC